MTDPAGSGIHLIDVLLPVRAPAPWFGEAIESVRRQSLADWRLLVVMDGWDSEIQDTCNSQNLGGQLRVVVLPAGSGLVSALNAGLGECRAEFVARMDADDVCLPGRFERQVEYLRRNPHCIAIGTGARVISASGEPLATRTRRRDGSVLRGLRWRNPLVHPSAMIRRDGLRAVGGYSPAARHAEDYDLWLRLARLGEIHAIHEELLLYRAHGDQVTASYRVSPDAERAIAVSRRALAQARGESEWAAIARHRVMHVIRRVKRA